MTARIAKAFYPAQTFARRRLKTSFGDRPAPVDFPQGFRFSLIGELGIACRIDGSPDWWNWVPLGWLTNDFGTSQFLDTAALTNVAQFYRTVTQ